MKHVAKLSPELAEWLNHTVYPKLSHEIVFGDLVNFTLAQSGESWYADCPYCHRRGTFYMLPHRQVGQCKSCQRTIGWFGYLRRKLNGDPAAITRIATLAGVPPLNGRLECDELIPVSDMDGVSNLFLAPDQLADPEDVPNP